MIICHCIHLEVIMIIYGNYNHYSSLYSMHLYLLYCIIYGNTVQQLIVMKLCI